MAIELSRQAETDSMNHATMESKLLALDAEQIAEAVAWSFEHPSPTQETFADRLEHMETHRRSRSQDSGNSYNDGSPTLLAGRRTLLAKGSPGGQGFDAIPAQRGWSISEEAERMPVFGDAACQSENGSGRWNQTRFRATTEMGSSVRMTSQSRVLSRHSHHSHHSRDVSIGLSRGDSRGTDWSAIIGPEFGHDVSHPTQQVLVPDMQLTGATISDHFLEEEAGYVPALDTNCSEAAISIFEVEEQSEDEHERFKI